MSIFRSVVILFFLGASTISVAEQPKLDMNDVSWLWPVPHTTSDLSSVITMDDLQSSDGQDVWSDSQFQDLLKVVDSDAVDVEGTDIDFQDAIKNKSVWRIAGMRFDPTAPGAHSTLIDALGSSPQLRLIVQPVTQSGGRVNIHDVAVHLVYQYVSGVDNQNRKIPNKQKLQEIIADLDQLKSLCQAGGVATAGKPLGVHPGLRSNVPGLHDKVKEFLGKHLSASSLDSMALMGIDNGVEPWIFLAMTRLPSGFGPIPVPIPAAQAQMIDFRRSSNGNVVPTPIVNNRNPIGRDKIVPAESRRGVATAAMSNMGMAELNNRAVIGKDASGNVVLDTQARNRDIPDIIANPRTSHFFNTDCVSCHTETRRRMSFNIPPGDFAFKVNGQPPRIARDALPQHHWNVRNFGWFTPHRFIGGGPAAPTVTQRTANETAEVVEFIERNFRGGSETLTAAAQ